MKTISYNQALKILSDEDLIIKIPDSGEVAKVIHIGYAEDIVCVTLTWGKDEEFYTDIFDQDNEGKEVKVVDNIMTVEDEHGELELAVFKAEPFIINTSKRKVKSF